MVSMERRPRALLMRASRSTRRSSAPLIWPPRQRGTRKEHAAPSARGWREYRLADPDARGKMSRCLVTASGAPWAFGEVLVRTCASASRRCWRCRTRCRPGRTGIRQRLQSLIWSPVWSWQLKTTEMFHASSWSSPRARCFNARCGRAGVIRTLLK